MEHKQKSTPILIPISEIFVSPQGEGITTGKLTLFVRVAGCNFFGPKSKPCRYCDTSYAWYSKAADTQVTAAKLISIIDDMCTVYHLNHVSITGGEPLNHRGIVDVIKGLDKHKYTMIETNGSFQVWFEGPHISWSVDIKGPSSGNQDKNVITNIPMLGMCDQIKFVIADMTDYDFALDFIRDTNPKTNIIFQPAFDQMDHKTLIEWMKRDSRFLQNVILGTQCHKLWYKPETRGV